MTHLQASIICYMPGLSYRYTTLCGIDWIPLAVNSVALLAPLRSVQFSSVIIAIHDARG